MKIALVSGGDHNYFPMLLEWVESVKRTQPDGLDIALCILDAGLSAEQVQVLEQRVTHVKSPAWPSVIPQSRIRGKDYLKACVARPFLKDVFPDYDLYIWLDGDTWVQDWAALDLLIKGAQKSGLAICPQTDRAYGKAMRLKWLGPIPFKARSFYYSNARKAFNGNIARALFPYPALNAGVFAIRADAPHWQAWQELIVKALRKGKVFTAEQLTLGMIVYLDGLPAEFLPAWCNWLLATAPVWDAENGVFVEPYLPHTPIGIMHLSGCDAMRKDRSVNMEIIALKGEPVEITYRSPHYDGEKDSMV